MSLRLVTRQSQRRNEVSVRVWIIGWADRDRPTGCVNRPVVLLQSETCARLHSVPSIQIWGARAQLNRLVRILEAPFKLADVEVVPAQGRIGEHVSRVQSERTFAFCDGFVGATLGQQYDCLITLSVGVVWIEG